MEMKLIEVQISNLPRWAAFFETFSQRPTAKILKWKFLVMMNTESHITLFYDKCFLFDIGSFENRWLLTKFERTILQIVVLLIWTFFAITDIISEPINWFSV